MRVHGHWRLLRSRADGRGMAIPAHPLCPAVALAAVTGAAVGLPALR